MFDLETSRHTTSAPIFRRCVRSTFRGITGLVLLLAGGCVNSDNDGLPWPDDPLGSLIIRTDFSDDGAWKKVRAAVEEPAEFQAFLTWVDDPQLDSLTVSQLVERARSAPDHPVAFLVDGETIQSAGHPILAVDLDGEPGRTFRVLPSAMWDVQINLAIANTSWEDYVDLLDGTGVYRGPPGL